LKAAKYIDEQPVEDLSTNDEHAHGGTS